MTDETTTTSQPEDALEPTLSDETGAVGDGTELSDGNRQPEETAEYWKERYSEARKGGEQASRAAQQAQQQLQQQAAQQQQMYQHYMGQQQQPQQQIGQDYLTNEERTMLDKATEELDIRAVNQIRDIASDRRQQQATYQAQQQMMQTAGTQYQQQNEMEFFKRNADILSDPVMQNEVLQEALRIQNDPVEASSIKGINDQTAYISTPTGAMVNRYAIAQVVREKRAELKQVKGKALKSSISNTIGAPGRGSGEPGRATSETFNPSVHLSSDERSMIDRMATKVQDPMTYASYWKGLNPKVKKARLSEGNSVAREKDYK
jgi:hypothetical protein